ncbi:hypothetical protein FNH22_25330 [Fulvivirga sp. M361]|uniref:hypothetical protein n=1 Tax=Fulvivirga sp. M361 TaxID=2594266 RepID=UPI00117A68BC|nr:hypothetical protein [Fulvivirga sp. M361]TRX50647.1 hypothetical protein FNH22_25330 [Fulvivirga sp. M361]
MKAVTLFILLCVVSVGHAQSVVDSTKRNYSSIHSNNTEAYLGISNHTATLGMNRIYNISRRTSFVYGLSYSRYHQPLREGGEGGALRYQWSFDIPLEFRYYLLPKENRLTAFLYGRVNNSFFDDLDYQPHIEMGAALQYKVSSHSSVFLKMNYAPRAFNTYRSIP